MEYSSVSAFFDEVTSDVETSEGESATSQVSSNVWSKNDILQLMGQESDRISFVEIKSKAAIYKNFNQVTIDEKLVSFVTCIKCKTLYAWTKSRGNHSLHRHICQVNTTTRGQNKPVTSTMDKFVRKIVPVAAVRQLNKNVTFGLLKDLKPLHSVERSGFRHMAQAFINFGAKFGAQNVDDCLHHRTTLQRYQVPELVSDTRKYYTELFKTANNNQFSFSKDLWSERYDKRHFLSMTMHFINDEWELMAITLGLDEVVETKTTVHLRKRCETMLGIYFEKERVPKIMEESYSITDGGLNMLELFGNHRPCYCHKLNCFVDWTLNDRVLGKRDQKRLDKGLAVDPKKLFTLQSSCPTIKSTITGIKELVTYFKRTALNSKLPTTLKQDVCTRWDSELNMLESYVAVKADIEAMLLENRQFEKLSGIDNEIVNELIDFLTPIRKCSRVLSGDKYPTIHLIAVRFSKLKMDIAIKEVDSPEIRLLKKQALICFDEYLVTDVFLCMACMLHPKYRQLRFVNSADDRRKATDLLKKLVEEQRRGEITTTGQLAEATDSLAPGASAKKSTGFEQFEDIENDNSQTYEITEVDNYLNHSFDLSPFIDDDDHFYILKFWKEATMFPNIRKVARIVLAIPAAETSDERTFASSGEALTPRRTRLEGSSLGDFVFVSKGLNEPPKL